MVPANRQAFGVSFEVAWVKAEASGRRISTYIIGIRFTRVLKGMVNFFSTSFAPAAHLTHCVSWQVSDNRPGQIAPACGRKVKSAFMTLVPLPATLTATRTESLRVRIARLRC